MGSCTWVVVSYFSENVYPLGRNPVNESLSAGKIILIFKGDEGIDDIFNVNDLERGYKLRDTDEYTFYVKKKFSVEDCAEKYILDAPYVEDHCSIISDKFKSLNLDKSVLVFCRIVNNREY